MSLTSEWCRTPWWVFWRKKWFRRYYDGSDRNWGGWIIEYANDRELARRTLEDTFGP